MSKIVSFDSKIRLKTSTDKREKIIVSLIELINREGFSACSHRRITEYAGVSLGAVQSLFSTKAKMLELLLAYSSDNFFVLMSNQELRKGDLNQRATMFTAMSWRYYRSDAYLAAIEVLMATRARHDLTSLVAAAQHRTDGYKACMHGVFPESKRLDDRELNEIGTTLHSFFTGLAIQVVMYPKLVNIGGYLRRATRDLIARIEG